MPFYTISADFEGGTYLSQLSADNPAMAVLTWAENLDINDIPDFGNQSKIYLVKDLNESHQEGSGPVPVNRLVNVWCTSSLIRGKLMIIDVIQTEQV